MLGLRAGGTGGLARVVRMRQEGSAKVFVPRVHSGLTEAVFLNTSGGLTGGDSLSFTLDLEAGAAAVGTTQTAERAYRSAAGRAEMRVQLSAGPGARLDWLPQETILFEGSALARRTTVHLAGDARLVFLEVVVLGRRAMGETLSAADLHDSREIIRDGVPVMMEPLRLSSQSLAREGAAAGLAGARAFATLALVAPGAEDALGPLRAALPAPGAPDGLRAAASGWNGRCLTRFLAADLWPLKRALGPVLSVLRGGAPLPRVWQG